MIKCDLCGYLIYRGIPELRREPQYGTVNFTTHAEGDDETWNDEHYLCDDCYHRAHQGFQTLKAEIMLKPTPGERKQKPDPERTNDNG